MAGTKRAQALPKRFEPYRRQAATEAAIRYGSQGSALSSIFGTTTRNYERQTQAQDAGARSLLGAYQRAPQELNRVYSDAGLSPAVLAGISASPTGTRLAGELAREQASILQQKIGAEAGAGYQRQHAADMYREDVGKINDQAMALGTERGQFESSLLDQLIGGDRAARHDANEQVRKQRFDADQAIQQQNAAQTNALIGQGLLPGADGTLAPLPGGKADPNAPANKPKSTRPKATAQQLAGASGQFGAALAALKTLDPDRGGRSDTESLLVSGTKSQPIYENVPVLDARGKPVPGKTKRQQKTTKNGVGISTPAIPKTDQVLAKAAADMYYEGHLTSGTVKALHELGYKVRALPNARTRSQASRPKGGRTRAPSRPATKADPYGSGSGHN